MIEKSVSEIESSMTDYIRSAEHGPSTSPDDLRDFFQIILRRLDVAVKNQELTPYEFGAVRSETRTVSEWIGTGPRKYANLAALKVDYPHVDSEDDLIDYAAIQKALNVAKEATHAGRRREVKIPCGNWWINKGLKGGHEVAIRGEGRTNSVINAAEGFPANTPMILMSRGGIEYEHGNAVHRLGIDCYGRSDEGLYWFNCNEHGGMYESEVKNFRKRGVYFGPKAGETYNRVLNFAIKDIHVVTDYAEPGSIGVYIKDVNHPLDIEKGTIIMRRSSRPGWDAQNPPPRDEIGMKIESGHAFRADISKYHIEECKHGIFVEYGQARIINAEGWDTVDSTVTLAATADACLLEDITCMNENGYAITDLGRIRSSDGQPLRYGIPVGTGPFHRRRYSNNHAPDFRSMGTGYGSFRPGVNPESRDPANPNYHWYKLWHLARFTPRVAVPTVYNTSGYRIGDVRIEEEDVFVRVYDPSGNIVADDGLDFGLQVEI